MNKQLRNIGLKGFCGAMAYLMTAPAIAKKDPSGGFIYLRDQGSEQIPALVQLFLIIFFATGVVMAGFGIAGIIKIGKDQVPDDQKRKPWFLLFVGAGLILLPLIIAVVIGVFGGDADSAAEAASEQDWGL